MAFELPPLLPGIPIVTTELYPTTQLIQLWQTMIEKLAAQEAAQDATLSAIKLTQSFTNPVGVATAMENGTVTIVTHDRVYGDGSSVSVTGGSITGLLNSTAYTIYYSDPQQTGGSVTYQATTNAVPQVGGTHVVAQVTIPAVAAAENTGAGPTAPGYTAPVYDGSYDPRDDRYDFIA